MMWIKIRGILAVLGILVLILDPKTAAAGTQAGLEVCLRSAIPSLFPFIVLSVWLTGNLGSMGLLRPLGRLCRMPEGGEGLLLTGALGGYPVGAQAVTQAWQEGRLSKEDAHRVLGFCSNAGPAFIFGMIGPLFSSPGACWLLWLVHIASFLLAGILLPGGSQGSMKPGQAGELTLPQAMKKSLNVMAGICGWILLFRLILGYLDSFLLVLPPEFRVFISGLLELTNGCLSLGTVSDEGVRFVLCAGMLGFGGLCVGMQTASVTAGLGTGLYFPGKLLQALLSVLLALGIKIIVAF